MTAFTSRSAESYDPEPWVDELGQRWAIPYSADYSRYDPRPEFEPTRDEFPWQDALGNVSPVRTGVNVHWAPRDRNRNRILIDIRKYVEERRVMNNPKGWDHVLRRFENAVEANPWNATPAEIEDARKVLERLANFKKED